MLMVKLRHRAIMAVGKTTAEVKYLHIDYSRWLPSAILDLLYAYFNHPHTKNV